MLIERDDSMLLMVDVQQKLVPAIHDQGAVVDACAWLLDVAREMAVPMVASEQYPHGLGHLLPEIAERLPTDAVFEKIEFSCADAAACRTAMNALSRRQVVIAGIEAHVCVLQTALGLLRGGYEVFVTADAVGSRRPEDVRLAMERLRHAGVGVVSREMVVFEWLRGADSDVFKRVSKAYLR